MTSREFSSLADPEKSEIERHLQSAPVKLSALASALGLRVIATDLPNGISGEIRPDIEPDKYVIRVNKKDSSRRQRFTVAHEIGHYLLHREAIGNGITDDVLYRSTLSDAREAQANRIAADLLMPDHLVSDWLEKAKKLDIDDKVGFLADKFNVSEAAMKIRLGLA